MMLEKECGIVDKPIFPALWEPSSKSGAMKKLVIDWIAPWDSQISDKLRRYRHVVTGLSEDCPTPVYGGILADVRICCSPLQLTNLLML
jgi:hypothetical protein